MASEGMHSPVEQVEIRPIFEMAAGGYDISLRECGVAVSFGRLRVMV